MRRVGLLLLLSLAVACRREPRATSAPAPDPPPAAGATAAHDDPPVACQNEWERVAKGIEYRTLNCTPRGLDLHLVRVDPQAAQIDAVLRGGSTAAEIARKESWTFAMNANFFDEHYQPLGVVMSNGREIHPLHPVSWQAVFYVTRNGRARIAPVVRWRDLRAGARTAVQAGPRIVVAAEKNRVAKATTDSRAGVCIDGAGRAVFFATPPATRLDVTQMVDLAARSESSGGLGCREAMLFDGGPSTQLYLRRPRGAVEVDGDRHVPAYLIVK